MIKKRKTQAKKLQADQPHAVSMTMKWDAIYQ